MNHVRFSVSLALVALLTAGCLGDDDDKPTRVNANGAVTDTSAPAPANPDAPDEPAGPVADPPVGAGGSTPASTPTNPPATTAPKPTATTAPKPAAPSGGEANVIKGVVRDEQGDPVPGAVITAAGYTARSNNVQRATTDAAGRYRLPVPEGLYTVSGLAPVTFEGKTFNEMYLHPTDGNCGQQMSAGGITKDFVLRLTGFKECLLAPDPKNAGSYNGGPVTLIHASPKSLPGDAKLTLTLAPIGALADGSPGKPLTFNRTVANLSTTAGPLETTNTLHDIPLGRYTISGHATLADGSRRELKFGPTSSASGTASYPFSFEPVAMVPYGIRYTTLNVYDGAAGTTPTPSTTPSTAPPTTPSTCYSQYVGPIPC